VCRLGDIAFSCTDVCNNCVVQTKNAMILDPVLEIRTFKEQTFNMHAHLVHQNWYRMNLTMITMTVYGLIFTATMTKLAKLPF
jgi:hypothetical protein